jgi:anti-sigma factor RsiW
VSAVGGAHPGEAALNDHVDGLLSAEDEARVSAHLASCDACRAEVEALERLLERTALLPRSAEPPASLWESVAARTVDARERPGRRSRSWRLPSWRLAALHGWQLAAAVVVLVALSSLVTALLVTGPGKDAATPGAGTAVAVGSAPGEAARTAAATRGAASPAALLEASYSPAISRLKTQFEARRTELSPATVQTVEKNLQIIDRAIAQTRAALAADPGSQSATQLMAAMYRQKIGMLERTLRLGT